MATNNDFKPDFRVFELFTNCLEKINFEQKTDLGKEISLTEVENAIENANNDSAPGPDGLTYSFYKSFKDQIKVILFAVYKHCFSNGEVKTLGKKSSTKLIPKTEKIPTVSQLRPICLQDVDFKIFSHVINSRIMEVMPSVITHNQYCTVKGRSSFDQIQILMSILSNFESKKNKGFLLSLDFFKAFDRANIFFITKIMEKMNFNKKIIEIVLSFHKNCFTNLKISNQSVCVSLYNALRQGEPLSATLFIIGIEPLIRKIERSVVGVKVGQNQYKVSAYCDDIQIASDNVSDIIKIEKIMTFFEKMSGLLLSRNEKCKIMGLGEWENKTEWPIEWLKSTDQLKILGIILTQKFRKTLDSTWEEIFRQIQKGIFSFKTREINTLNQRVFCLHTFILSKLWYAAQILILPAKFAQQIEVLMRQYIWHNKPFHLNFPSLFNSKMKGGLQLFNIRLKAKTLFQNRIFTQFQTNHPVKHHLQYWTGIGHPNVKSGYQNLHFARIKKFYIEIKSKIDGGLYSLSDMTAKKLYAYFFEIDPPPAPLIVQRKDYKFKLIYKRIWDTQKFLPNETDTFFSFFNQILPTPNKLFQINLTESDKCCFHPLEVVSDKHIFIDCSSTAEKFDYLLFKIGQIAPKLKNLNHMDILTLNFEKTPKESLINKLIIKYIHFTWENFRFNKKSSLEDFIQALK